MSRYPDNARRGANGAASPTWQPRSFPHPLKPDNTKDATHGGDQ